MSAYVVGGVVRDILLKKKNCDLDVSIEGNAIALAKTLAKRTKAQLTVHKQFKTASLQWLDGTCVDLATVRKERYSRSGALPIVQIGTLRNDLFRRDFTINAMALMINANGFGQLVDEFGGLKDLRSKKIRVLHDNSFIDDPTRILRAIRFEQRLNFQIERKTLSQIKLVLSKNIVKNVKPPRYFAEFRKILCEANPVKPLKRLDRLKGFHFLDTKLQIRFQELNSTHDCIQKLRKKSIYKEYDSWWLIYFMVLLSKLTNRVVENILEKFHFSKIEQKSIQQSREASDIIKRLSVKSLLASQVYRILELLTEDSIVYLRVRTLNVLVCRRIDQYLSRDIHIKLQINGEDLKKNGIVSGLKIGQALKCALYSKIDRQVSTKRDELKKALQSLEKY